MKFKQNITRAIESGIIFTNTVQRHDGDWRDRYHWELVGQPGRRHIASGDGNGWSTLSKCVKNASKYLEGLKSEN